jgi:hypothetical protein
MTSALDGVNGQSHAPAVLFLRENIPGTHWIGGWVGLRTGLDTEARGEFFNPDGDRTLIVQSVVRHYTN